MTRHPLVRVAFTLTCAAAAACSASGDAGVDASPLPDAALDAAEADASPPLSTLVVNEVAAAGDPADWIEVINNTGVAIDLSDYVFVDVAGDLVKARSFPEAMLAPGARHVEEVTDEANGFKLGSDEEVWVYRASDGRLSDGANWAEGESPAAGSFARVPDVTGAFVVAVTHTRGAPN